MPFKMGYPKIRSDAYYDPTREQNINRDADRQEVWNKHCAEPGLGVEARRRLEEWEEAGSSTAGGSRN